MMTREEVLSIEEYCAEHKISHKKPLEELGISPWSYYAASALLYSKMIFNCIQVSFYRILESADAHHKISI